MLSSFPSFGRRFLLVGLFAGASLCATRAQEPQKDTPPPAAATVPQRIRVGGTVQQAKILHLVQPKYPRDAKKKHIQGTVALHAIVARDGTITELQFISGPPELMQAAMDAVKQWQYQPTTLNGHPVEVDTSILVVFTLGSKPG